MSLTRKLTLALLAGAASLTVVGAGTAHAEGRQFGAVAVEKSSTPFGVSTFYGSVADSPEVARQAAAARCGESTGNADAVCDLVTWSNGCVAAATRGDRYQWAEGPTREIARQNALNLSNAIGATGSAIALPAAISYDACTD
ncbi:DUF4189 domain-containing protein [Nocardia sp. CA-120079]|uniref:DUF4189 domain-containing protein n=1 Tax=Nocardia sp. CA-120079 TaxID=3239974 RepID=UPI003D965B38